MNRIAFYDTRSYDKEAFVKENEKYGFEIEFFDFKLTEKTALTSKGFDAVCVFVNDTLNSKVISILNECGVKVILLRCAGFNNVDLHGLTAGVFGTGKIGRCMADILNGFGMKIICYDPFPDKEWALQKGYSYVDVAAFLRKVMF